MNNDNFNNDIFSFNNSLKSNNLFEKLFEIPNGLNKVRRYSRDYMSRPETVLEHSATVAMFATQLGMYINNKLNENIIDLGKLALKGLYHDVTEFILGDIPRLTKYSSPEFKNLCDKLDVKCIKFLSDYININPDYFYDLVYNAKDKTLEGVIIKISDILSVINQCCIEIFDLGNKGFQNVLNESSKILKSNFLKDFLSEVIKENKNKIDIVLLNSFKSIIFDILKSTIEYLDNKSNVN